MIQVINTIYVVILFGVIIAAVFLYIHGMITAFRDD